MLSSGLVEYTDCTSEEDYNLTLQQLCWKLHLTVSNGVCLVLEFWMNISSSSSYHAGSTDIPDPLSPLLPIVHRPR